MNGKRCSVCHDTGKILALPSGERVDCTLCKPRVSTGIAPARASDGLAAPVRGRQVPPFGPIGTTHIDALPPSEVWERGAREPLHFTLTDAEPQERSVVHYCPLCRAEFDTPDPSGTFIEYRRHDDICPIKRAFWHGATWGWCVGVVMTAAAVAWRLHGTLLP